MGGNIPQRAVVPVPVDAVWAPPHFPALPTLSWTSWVYSGSYGGLAAAWSWPSDSCPGIWSQAEKLPDAHAWWGCRTVFHMLCKPGIMLLCILFFSLNVLVEWSPNVKYNFQVVGCMMACVVDIWSLWCWKALGCYWSSLFLETLRTSSLLLIYVYGCFWSLL